MPKNHGMGKITYLDGHSYDGDWYEGLKQGIGLEIQPDGSTYNGAFCSRTPTWKR